MAGEHRYSSSLFIQSGAVAQFKNGITASSLNIEGSVTADKYLLSDGTIAGNPEVFFAGAPGDLTSGISRSAANGGPESQDNFISLTNENQDPGDSTKVAIDTIFIQATGSTTFKPNFFNFIKLGDDPNIVAQGLAGSTVNATTVQQGELSSYNPSSAAERQTGVHRYMIFAAETGPNGKTHQKFHTVTIDAFSNIAPTIISPENTHVSLSMEHNLDSGSLVLYFTNSFDQNQIDDGDLVDYLTEFSVTRQSSDPDLSSISDTSDAFSLSLNHDDITSPAQSITIGGPELESPGLSSSAGAPKLHFTASVENYNTVYDPVYNTIAFSKIQNQDFKITLIDTQADSPTAPGTTELQPFTIVIIPPPTASIENIKIRFEGSDNEGGFSNIPSNTHNHVLLYDKGSTLTSKSISELDDRYTSSLVRMRVTSDITPPIGYVKTESNYDTRIQIHETTDSDDISSGDPTFNTFKFKNTEQTASYTGSSTTDFNSIEENENITTESNGFTSFEITPNFGESNTVVQHFYGTVNVDSSDDNLNRIDEVQHGRHNHYKVLNVENAIVLDINKCPDILVKNAKVEIQRGSKYWEQDEGESSITTTILYGLSETLQSYQTQSKILTPLGVAADTHPHIFTAQGFDGGNYITESIIRLRVLADIIEPFGPDHTSITAKLSDDTNTHYHDFIFTIDNDDDVISSNFGYTTNHGYGTFGAQNNLDYVNKELLTGSYTFSWVEFNFDVGSYTFNASFIRTDQDSTKTQIRQDIATIPATLTLNQTPNTDLENLNYQIETFGYSDVLTNTSSRDILYGDNHHTNSTSESKSWKNHPLAETYASHSVTRFKVSGKLIEPFGPGRSQVEITPSIVNQLSTGVENILGSTSIISVLTQNETNYVNDTLLVNYVSNQLVTEFTSSFNGVRLDLDSSEYGIPQTYEIGNATYTYNGPFTKEPTYFDADNTLDPNPITQSAKLTVRDTFKTEIIDIVYETETSGYANVGDDSLETVTTESKRTVLYGFPHHTTIDSSSFENHPTASRYASHSIARFRVRAKVIEPIGYLHTASRFEEVWKNNIDNEEFTNTLHFETGSSKSPNPHPTSIQNSSSGYDLRNRLTSSYTSSWIGRQLSSSINGPKTWLYTSGSILHEPEGENKFITSSHNSTSLVINDTEPTKISHIIYETETFGYSSEPSLDEKRTVLYGDSHITNADSSSTDWVDHERADAYASQSVSRFRVRFKVTEPLGPLHYTSSLQKEWYSNFANHQTPNLKFHTASQTAVVSKSYDSQKRLVVEYTSSFEGKQLTTSPESITQYTYSGSFTHEPEGENSASFIELSPAKLKVHDTPKTEIVVDRIEIETFGGSEIGHQNPHQTQFLTDPETGINTPLMSFDFTAISRSLVSGFNTTQTTLDFGDFNPTLVSRFRTLVHIKEPIGHLHHATKLRFPFKAVGHDNNPPDILSPLITFTTNSNSSILPFFDKGILNFGYNEYNQLTASYTSSFSGSQLTPTDTGEDVFGGGPDFAYWEGTYDDANAVKLHDPEGENGFTFTTIERNTDFDESGAVIEEGHTHKIALQVSSSLSDILRPQITKLKLEVETVSGSNVGSFERMLTIPHGNSATLIDQAVNNTYVLGSSGSLVSVRVLADIEETPGPSHFVTQIEIGGYSVDNDGNNTKIINFATDSSDVASHDFTPSSLEVGAITKYTSSFFTIGLSASAQVDPITNFNAETKDFAISASVISYNNVSTDGIGFDVITSLEPSHSIIHVTGALSSSIATTLNTSSLNLSSSIFADGEEESLYYLYHRNFPQVGTNEFVSPTAEFLKLSPTLVVTPPLSASDDQGLLPITSESNLTFPNNIDIQYTIVSSQPYLASLGLSFTETSNPSNGTASIRLKEEHEEGGVDVGLNTLTKPETIRLTCTPSDLSIGDGKGQDVKTIFIIPAQPPTMSGNLTGSSFSFNNNKLYRGALPSHSFDHYKEGESPENPNTFVNVTNILITSKSDGTGNDYSMSFHTPTGNSGNYSNENRAFSHGDSGSLIVKINGVPVVNYDLQSSFNTSLKAGPQNMSTYPGEGTASFYNDGDTTFNNKGKLILHSVTPFNEVTQSLFVENEFLPNGFQVFSASIFLDEKMRDGYNFLEFSHSIDDTRTISMDKFEWYYDDGLNKPEFGIVINEGSGENASTSDENFAVRSLQWLSYLNTPATFSLSGVSYFMKDKDFLLSLFPTENDMGNYGSLSFTQDYSFVGITGISHKTYIAQPPMETGIVAVTQRIGTDYTITSGSEFNTLHHILDNVQNKNGLTVDIYQKYKKYEGGPSFDKNLIPSSSSTASIMALTINCNNADFSLNDTFQNTIPSNTSLNSGDSYLYKGVLKEIQFRLSRRFLSTPSNWDYGTDPQVILPIGRFIDTSSIDTGHTGEFNTGSIHQENFHTEDYRWKYLTWVSDSFLEEARDDYSYFINQSNCDFNSNSIRLGDGNTPPTEMFQSVLGALVPVHFGVSNSTSFTNYKNTPDIGNNDPQLNLTTPSNYKVFLPNRTRFENLDTNNDSSQFSTKYNRAFKLPGDLTGAINTFKLELVGNFGAFTGNVFDSGVPIDGLASTATFDPIPGSVFGKGLKIEIRLPGPVAGNSTQTAALPGTKWGVITGGTDTTSNSVKTVDGWNACTNVSFTDGPSIPFRQRTNTSNFNVDPTNYQIITYTVNLGNYSLNENTDGIVLVRLSHLNSDTNYFAMNPYYRSIRILRDE